MNLDRRQFLHGMGGGVAGALIAGSTARAATAGPATLPAFSTSTSADFWRAVRAHFPLQDDPVYLNCGGLGH
ncbi:MAG: hypothetical protein NTZ29_06350, partial [Verrucomicrobia bacterium]|nr:hypothetical protein [Verrucomicrobiota bacterium]